MLASAVAIADCSEAKSVAAAAADFSATSAASALVKRSISVGVCPVECNDVVVAVNDHLVD